MATIAGDLTVNAIQMTATAFGLAAIFAISAEFFQVLKWFGVMYLGYLGFRLVMSQEKPPSLESKKKR